jgi:hypothetical protein
LVTELISVSASCSRESCLSSGRLESLDCAIASIELSATTSPITVKASRQLRKVFIVLQSAQLFANSEPGQRAGRQGKAEYNNKEYFSLGGIVGSDIPHLLHVEIRRHVLHQVSVGRTAALPVLEKFELGDKIVRVLPGMIWIVWIPR